MVHYIEKGFDTLFIVKYNRSEGFQPCCLGPPWSSLVPFLRNEQMSCRKDPCLGHDIDSRRVALYSNNKFDHKLDSCKIEIPHELQIDISRGFQLLQNPSSHKAGLSILVNSLQENKDDPQKRR